MELEEIIKEIVNKKGSYNDIITKEDLIPYYYHLTHCTSFRDCNIEFLDDATRYPKPKSIKLSGGPMFKGTVLIGDFTVTPPLYILDELNKRPENDAMISPVFYNPADFTPYKFIKIWFSPEKLNDDYADSVIRNSLIGKFNDVLNNPKKYAAPKNHGLIMKGIFTMKEEYDKQNILLIKI
jgi:hypothetical protein